MAQSSSSTSSHRSPAAGTVPANSCVTRCAKCRGRLPAGADEGGRGCETGELRQAAELCPCARGCAMEWLRLVGPLRRRAEDPAATLRAAAAKRSFAHDLLRPHLWLVPPPSAYCPG